MSKPGDVGMMLAIEFTLGALYLATGLSCLLRPTIWQVWMDRMAEDGETAAPAMGMVGVAFGAFVVAAHPVYSGTAFLVTLIGFLGLFKGTVYLLFPAVFAFLVRWISMRWGKWYRALSLFCILLGLLILAIWASWPGLEDLSYGSVFNARDIFALPPPPVHV